MAISINDYQTSPFFDEYLNSAKSFWPHTKKIGHPYIFKEKKTLMVSLLSSLWVYLLGFTQRSSLRDRIDH